jgi:hypothetical protein
MTIDRVASNLLSSTPQLSRATRRAAFPLATESLSMAVDRKEIERRYMRHAMRRAHQITRHEIETGRTSESYGATLARHMRFHVPLMNEEIRRVFEATDSVESWLDDMRAANKKRREAVSTIHNA